MVWSAVVMVAAVAGCVAGMTVTQQEAAGLPDELKPILPGGSWFDDMAIKRLRIRHKELKELGHPEGEEDQEQQFIMARLKDPEITLLPQDDLDLPAPVHKAQNTREALRAFLRQQTGGGGAEAGDSVSVTTSREFMEIYERELHNFFENFMSAMLQAEIGGVSIENRSEDAETFQVEEVAGQSNAVVNP